MKPIIGFCGYAQVGKDTAAQALVKQGWTRIAFADQVKDDLAPFIKEHFGWDIFSLDPEQKDIIRPIMVEYACSKRKTDPDYWIKRLWEKYIDAIEPEVGWVISDVRYFNEYYVIKYGINGDALKPNNIVFGITRPGYRPMNKEEKIYTQELLSYIKVNQPLYEFSLWTSFNKFIIHNDGTIEDLHKKVLKRVEWAEEMGLLNRGEKNG